jgi:hypothetical protein
MDAGIFAGHAQKGLPGRLMIMVPTVDIQSG